MPLCIYTKTLFDTSDGEHILQNFLGARWTSHEIASNDTQALFGRTIDNALEKGLKEFRGLLGTKGGRGGAGPDLKFVIDTEGRKYHLKPGGIPILAEPVIETNNLTDDSTEIHAKVGSKKQIGWLLEQLRQRFPGIKFDADLLVQEGEITSAYLADPVKLQTRLGDEKYLRGTLKSAFNLLGVKEYELALNVCFDPVRKYILYG